MLLRYATMLDEMDDAMTRIVSEDVIAGILAMVPDAWLTDRSPDAQPGEVRAAYRRYLLDRLEPPRPFVQEAARAR